MQLLLAALKDRGGGGGGGGGAGTGELLIAVVVEGVNDL